MEPKIRRISNPFPRKQLHEAALLSKGGYPQLERGVQEWCDVLARFTEEPHQAYGAFEKNGRLVALGTAGPLTHPSNAATMEIAQEHGATPESSVFLSGLVVAREHQNTGLAPRILRHALDECLKQGMTHAVMAVQDENQAMQYHLRQFKSGTGEYVDFLGVRLQVHVIPLEKWGRMTKAR